MGENAGNLADILLHLAFQARDAVVGLLQAEPFVEFHVLLHVQTAADVLHADVVHVEVVARGDRADAVEEAFLPAGARHGVHHHVGVGQTARMRAATSLETCSDF